MIVIYRPWLTRLLAILIAVLTLGFVWIDHPRTGRIPHMRLIRRWFITLKARWRGRRDGRLGIPRPDEPKAPPEVWRLKQEGDGVVRGIAAKWAATDARLVGEHEATQRAIGSVDHAVERMKAEVATLTDRCERRRDHLNQKKQSEEKREAEERWRIPTWFYAGALFTIFAGEFPLNAVAFNLFGENRWATYVMTAGLAAVLVFCAHSLGILWRKRAMSDRDHLVTWLLAILPVLVIAGIAIVRVDYLQALNATESSTGLAVLSPTMGILIFIMMNLVIYLGAFALSYLHHDPAGELLERLEREVARADHRVQGRERDIERAHNLRHWLLTKLALWDGARDGAHRHAAFQAKRHKDFFEAFMQEYWAANRLATERAFKRAERRARRRGEKIPVGAEKWKPPKSLEDPPKIKLPPQLEPDAPIKPPLPQDGRQPATTVGRESPEMLSALNEPTHRDRREDGQPPAAPVDRETEQIG
jgi:hypothetical protein